LPPFSVKLDTPLVGDAERAGALAKASAERYGRALESVEAARQSAHARIRASHEPALVLAAPAGPVTPARNEHRKRKKKRRAEEVPANA
jgi:hypothetical protein